jgi:hypothetical protein
LNETNTDLPSNLGNLSDILSSGTDFTEITWPQPPDFQPLPPTNKSFPHVRHWPCFCLLQKAYDSKATVYFRRQDLPEFMQDLEPMKIKRSLSYANSLYFKKKLVAVVDWDNPEHMWLRVLPKDQISMETKRKRRHTHIPMRPTLLRSVPTMDLKVFRSWITILASGEQGTIIINRASDEILKEAKRYIQGFIPTPRGLIFVVEGIQVRVSGK